MKKRAVLLCSLVLAMCFTFFWSAWAAQRSLADKLVRLHVIANSDSEADQALKLEVRDAVLAEAEILLADCKTQAEAQAALQDALPALEEMAIRTLEENSCGDTVSASLSRELYPKRTYESFSLPAGEYLSLRLTIGEGAGQNWWCVVFPPLCLAATTEEFDQSAAEAGFSDEELALIKEESDGVLIRFKVVEWVENLFG